MRMFANWRRKRSQPEVPFVGEKRPLSEIERAIVDMAISTMKSGQREARAQLAVAAYGGPAHPGTHLCFMIDVSGDVELIPQIRDIVNLQVDSAPDDSLEVTLFVEGGRLGSVDLTRFASDKSESEWPSLDRIHPPTRV